MFNMGYEYPTVLTTIEIPSTVTSIGRDVVDIVVDDVIIINIVVVILVLLFLY